jgi:hypothetical protein
MVLTLICCIKWCIGRSIHSVHGILPISLLHTFCTHNTSHRSAAYIQYTEYYPLVSCIYSVQRILPIGQLHTFCTWHTPHQWAAQIQYTEYFPSISCIHSVRGKLPISQLHTFCTHNTSHWSDAYILYMRYFTSVSCIHSVHRILPILLRLICTIQKTISNENYRERLVEFTKALMYKWDVMIAYYP